MSGVWISALKLSHFRSHKRLEMELDPRPVALFGPNGAGKTNIIEAISFLSPGRGLRRAGVGDIARRPEALGWSIRASLSGPQTTHEIDTRSDNGGPRTVRLDEKPVPQLALGAVAPLVWLVPAMDRLWTEAAEGRRRFLDRLTMGYRPDHGSVSVAYEKAMRERNRLLKDGVTDPAWFGALEKQMADAGVAVHDNRLAALTRLDQALAEDEGAFPRVGLTLVGPDGPEENPIQPSDFAMALADGRYRDIAAGRTLIGPHRADLEAIYTAKDLAARDCSTGEQKALLLSLVLANARALRADFGAAPLLLLDEVAAHLDADRRGALYDEITALGAQAWMTGTGPELFDALGDRAQRFSVTDENGTSALTPT